MQLSLWTLLMLMILGFSGGCSAEAGVSPSVGYLDCIDAGIGRSRKQLPQMVNSAEEAARRITAGGHLWIGGSQPDFGKEAVGRAGGLMGIHFARSAAVGKDDVVLVGARGELTTDDLSDIARWRAAGAYVVAFASARACAHDKVKVDALIDCGDAGIRCNGGKFLPTDTVMNLVNLWTWTAEFTSACTRMGKCPVFYLSYGMKDGHAWARRYKGKMFHDDLHVNAVGARTLGMQYLEHIERMIAGIEREQRLLAEAGAWVKIVPRGGRELSVMGHIYPAHFRDPRAPVLFAKMSSWPRRPQDEPAKFMFLLGYQYPPDEYLPCMRTGDRLIYTTQRQSTRAAGRNVLYIDPHWPLEDACCRIAGYPIPVLPASGVAQAAIYWSVAGEAVEQRR